MNTSANLSGVDIKGVMTSHGPIVKCVILRASTPENNSIDVTADVSTMKPDEMKRELSSYGMDASSFAEGEELAKALKNARTRLAEQEEGGDDDDDSSANDEDGAPLKIVPLQHLIEQITIDTTPKKSMVTTVLGGSFTFLGQYEEEGTMVMIRRPDWENPEGGFVGDVPPVNEHPLQPPLDRVEVRGDILLMRVAKTEEDEDGVAVDGVEEGKLKMPAESDGVPNAKEIEPAASSLVSNPTGENAPSKPAAEATASEFFLNYTRDEYLAFAARTDVVAQGDHANYNSDADGDEEEDAGDAEESLEADGSDSDEDFDPADEPDEEEAQVGMMNMILGHLLRRFREENGRGPDSNELLEMRRALADKLGVEVPSADGNGADSPVDSEIEKPGSRKKVSLAEDKNEIEGELKRSKGGVEEVVGSVAKKVKLGELLEQ